MLTTISISRDDIFHQLKLSCQIPTIIEGTIARKIILSTAKSLGISLQTEELQQAADNFRILKKLQGAEQTWNWLQTHSLSLDDFEELVYINVISVKLAEHLFADKIQQFYIENQLNYMSAFIYEVVLNNEDLAMELFYALIEDEISFPEVAQKYIQEPELRRVGGYQGKVSRKEMKPDISAAVFASKPPQILKPIITSQGVHLIFVEELVEPNLDENLRERILLDLLSKWLKQQVENMEVIMNLNSDAPVNSN
ncbi:peptidylprolyl isomerase [Scytonema sp. NUACC26]|uniref:peptidylprolyl isomerase n=1 Tax=Scytonema sp. NUACC26 TaxID=3140176 RepID=UPI0034DC118F